MLKIEKNIRAKGLKMTPYNRLSKQKRKIIDYCRANNGVINSYVLKKESGLNMIQGSVRIKELREFDGWPFNAPDKRKRLPDGSVDYVLDLNKLKEPEYVFIGNTAYRKGDVEKKTNEQLGLL